MSASQQFDNPNNRSNSRIGVPGTSRIGQGVDPQKRSVMGGGGVQYSSVGKAGKGGKHSSIVAVSALEGAGLLT